MTDSTPGCCAPKRAATPLTLGIAPAASAQSPQGQPADRHLIEQCRIPAGGFIMGDSTGDGLKSDGELPLHSVTLNAFDIDATPVTNVQFAQFVRHTGYVTEAERFGSSSVFHLLVAAEAGAIVDPVTGTPWWVEVRGASWRNPGGPESNLHGLAEHPAVHISWNDANAYCEWAGRRLPTEAEWERASRGGIDGACFPWGDEPIDGSDGTWRANVWQGTFPSHNTAGDGHIGTAPVRSYSPNGFGLWQSVGNVWEWCADGFDALAYARRKAAAAETERETHDPRGPKSAREHVLRGGSYLCHPSYCNRYRNSARSKNTPDSSMGNAGFRTVGLP